VTLIRHGESENNILSEVGSEAYRKGRFADPPLTDLGRRQAQITAEYLCGDDCNDLIKKPDTIYVSPFLRTLQTSFPTASKLSSASNVVVWDDIFEISGCHKDGVPMGGLTSQEVAKEVRGGRSEATSCYRNS
jgi:broad specificity phosphatase PhoE